MSHGIGRFARLGVWVCFLSFLAGAEGAPLVRVPTDFATIQGAIGAVDPGGTVLIEDSATYSEEIVIQKAGISVVAADGANPVIQYSGGNSYMVYADQPCQFGSVAGGKITLNENSGGPGVLTHVFRPLHSAGEVRFENIDVVNVRPNTQIFYPDASTGDVTAVKVDVDGGGVLSFAIRLDFLNSVLRAPNTMRSLP